MCRIFFLNETAAFSDVFLPAVCFAELDGTQTNTERRVQRWHKATEPPGKAQADWEIITAIASAMGYAGQFAWTSYADIFAELAALTPLYSGLRMIAFFHPMVFSGLAPLKNIWGPRLSTRNVFQPMTVVLFFLPAAGQLDVEKTDEHYPFLFTTGRCIFHWDTGSMTRKSSVVNTGKWIGISTTDAKRLGIATGDQVSLITWDLNIPATARITEEILR